MTCRATTFAASAACPARHKRRSGHSLAVRSETCPDNHSCIRKGKPALDGAGLVIIPRGRYTVHHQGS